MQHSAFNHTHTIKMDNTDGRLVRSSSAESVTSINDSSNEHFDYHSSYNSIAHHHNESRKKKTNALISRLTTTMYAPRTQNEQSDRPPIESITGDILHVIQATRSPSHYFRGPFFDRAGREHAPFFDHETSLQDRRLTICTPVYIPPNVFAEMPDFRPYSDYLLDFSSVDFFTYFNELVVLGNDAILHTNIFYVQLPTRTPENACNLFLRTLDLRNIILTKDLFCSIETLTIDTLTLTGAVFTLLELQIPSSVAKLTLGAIASAPYLDQSTQKTVPYIMLNLSRCMHLQEITFENGCLWKEKTTHVCKLSTMYGFCGIQPSVPHVNTMTLVLHPIEILEKSYTVVLTAFKQIDTLSLRRFAHGRSSFNIVPRIDDNTSYAQPESVTNVDVKNIVSQWHEHGITRIHIDATFFSLLPFSDKKRWYMLFRAVEWEAPPERIIPLVFETEFPLVFIPPEEKDANANNTLSVYIPASHQIDNDPTAHVVIRQSSYAAGSFLLFRSEKTMCSVPSNAKLITIADQPLLLPVEQSSGIKAWLYSKLPSNPFGTQRPL